jgi:hypothetical protein
LLREVREEKRKEMCVLQRSMDVRATLAIGALKGNGDVCLLKSMEVRVALVEHYGF